ncbi:MAG: ParA family protein [Candidatus Atribacteria bacterium]|nr:ParA family protein [Candidatus Atribacteria bacterium]MCD6350335.1 ParA family protein [Candidatus Atribacteria bacterium]
MRRLAITNQKGGVGKTTTAANLGASLALMGRKVLLVDLDPQSGLTVSLGFDPQEVSYTVADFLESSDSKPKLLSVEPDNLYLLPSNYDLTVVEYQLQKKRKVLSEKLKIFEGEFDYAIVDCPPSLGWLVVNALVWTEMVIVPVQAEYLSMISLGRFNQLFSSIVNPDSSAEIRALITMYMKRTYHSEEVLRILREHFPTFETVITRTVKFAYSTVAGKPLVVMYPDSEQAKQYKNLALEVEEWAKSRP